MLSISELVLKYDDYTGEELYDIHFKRGGYCKEAQKALQIVLEKKGGLDALLKRLEEKRIVEKEIQRIERETSQMGSSGIDSSFIKTTTVSKILPAGKVNEIIDNKFVEVEHVLEHKKIRPRTIAGGITGGQSRVLSEAFCGDYR